MKTKKKPVTECSNCLSDLYYGDEVYTFYDLTQNYILCEQCGPDAIIERYEPDHKVILDEEHI